jgi:hypothetical protein
MILETKEVSWLLIFVQVKKVHLSSTFFSVSPGCGQRRVRVKANRHAHIRGQPRKTGQVWLFKQEADLWVPPTPGQWGEGPQGKEPTCGHIIQKVDPLSNPPLHMK